MNTQTAYCSACDKPVRIALTPAPVHGGQASLPDSPEVVCLDFGAKCTGELCPMFGLPRILMGMRLARSGLKEEGWTTIEAPCDGCGAPREMEVIDATHAYCPTCGTVNRYVFLDLEDGRYVAVGRPEERASEPQQP